MCQHFERLALGGGRNRKDTKRRGRPLGESSNLLLHALEELAPPSLFPAEDEAPQCHDSSLSGKLNCPICLSLADRPLELTCGAIACMECCCRWVKHHSCATLSCPCCYDHQLDSSQIRRPPPMVSSLMEGLLVHCVKGCGKLVRLDHYRLHLDSNCHNHHQLEDSPSRMTLSEVLARPTSSPATPAEMRVAEHLVRRIIDHNGSDERVFKVPTRGQVKLIKHNNYSCIMI